MSMTNEQINALTDPQINVMMQASVTGARKYMSTTSIKTLFYEDGGIVAVNARDYCNDPAAMWPIIDELTADGGIVQIARVGVILYPASGGSIDCLHKNKLRAAAIVYLKMKGVL